MNRKQAERLIEAYTEVVTYEAGIKECDDWAIDMMVALQDIIIDAMTTDKPTTITLPQSTFTKPIVTWDTSPIVTWDTSPIVTSSGDAE